MIYEVTLSSSSDPVVLATVQAGCHCSASPDLTLHRHPLMLSHLKSQWGELRSEAAFGTIACVAGSSVIMVALLPPVGNC
jgi:hypothetical protein